MLMGNGLLPAKFPAGTETQDLLDVAFHCVLGSATIGKVVARVEVEWPNTKLEFSVGVGTARGSSTL
jgi:hypothetical protein